MKLTKQKFNRFNKYILLLYSLIVVVTLGISVYKTIANTDTVTGTLTINHYCIFTTNVDTGGITFGGSAGLNPNSNTIGVVNSIFVTDTGNLASNILVSGSNWNYLTNSFFVTNTIWTTNAGIPNTLFGPITSCGTENPHTYSTNTEIYLCGSSTDTGAVVSTAVGNALYYGVSVPAGQAPGTYTQTINVISSC